MCGNPLLIQILVIVFHVRIVIIRWRYVFVFRFSEFVFCVRRCNVWRTRFIGSTLVGVSVFVLFVSLRGFLFHVRLVIVRWCYVFVFRFSEFVFCVRRCNVWRTRFIGSTLVGVSVFVLSVCFVFVAVLCGGHVSSGLPSLVVSCSCCVHRHLVGSQ